MKDNNKKKKNIILKIIGGSSIVTIAGVMILFICILLILDFFGTKLTKEKVQNNSEYAEDYIKAVNKNLKNGYVPLQRILYFYLEDRSLSVDTLYTMNQNSTTKTTKEIISVCEDLRVKNYGACTESNLKENADYLVVSTGRFNFPLVEDFEVKSFYKEERIIYEESNVHGGWDFAVAAQTPIYSVCSGIVENVTYTQSENIPFDQSNNSIGNTIVVKCDTDYSEIYYVSYAHLYPNSAKVKVGDRVNHWTEIASVGTTGHSTGNHLHYQVRDANGELLDGMYLIDLTLTKTFNDKYFNNKPNELEASYLP